MEIWNRQWQPLKNEKFEVGMGDQKIHALTRKIFLKIAPPGNGDIIGDQEDRKSVV